MTMKERNRKKRIFSFVGMLLFICLGVAVTVNEALAASAVVSLSTGEAEVLKGDTFSVTVTVESADDIGNVELFVVFDSSKVSFIDNGKYTIGGDGLVLISDWNDSADSTRKKYMLEFEAKKKGTCKFSVGDQPAIYLADSEEQMSVSSINMSVDVVKKQTEPEVEKDTQEVTVTEKPVSEQMTESQNATVEEDGENSNIETEPEVGIHTLETEDGIVITQYTKLMVKKVEDDALVPNGYMKTSIRLGEMPVIVYIPENDMGSEVYLVYGTDGMGNTGFYEYNRVENTIKKYVADYDGDTSGDSVEVVSANFQMMTAIIILLILCAVLSVSLVLQRMKKRQIRMPDEDIDTDLFKDYL